MFGARQHQELAAWWSQWDEISLVGVGQSQVERKLKDLSVVAVIKMTSDIEFVACYSFPASQTFCCVTMFCIIEKMKNTANAVFTLDKCQCADLSQFELSDCIVPLPIWGMFCSTSLTSLQP